MTNDTKQQTKTVTKIVGGIVLASVAFVVLTDYLLPAKQPVVGFTWDYPASEVQDTIFEFSWKTNLTGSWMFYTNVTGTNVIYVPKNLPQAFFTISKCMNRYETNIYIKQKGF